MKRSEKIMIQIEEQPNQFHPDGRIDTRLAWRRLFEWLDDIDTEVMQLREEVNGK